MSSEILCWCGTARPFKECHGRPAHPRATGRSYTAALRKFFERPVCMAPTVHGKACGKVIAAHTISRAASLSHLADESNHVRRLGVLDPRPQRIGWRQASTFRGFCNVHDAMFSAVDSGPEELTAHHCFLLLYRSVAFEVYQKGAAHDSHGTARTHLQEAGVESEGLALLDHFQESTALGLRDISAHKARLDRSLRENTFEAWSHLVVRFRGSPAVGCSGAYAPYLDLDGNELQDFMDEELELEMVGLNTAVHQDHTSFVLSWARDSVVGRRLADSLHQVGSAQLPHTFAQLPFLLLENTYFSGRWWDSRQAWVQETIAELVTTMSPFMTAPRLATKRVVEWELEDVQLVGAA